MSRPDDRDPRARSPQFTPVGEPHGRPRVVIFECEGEPRVEILELPETATLGACFCHSGTEWRVMATRTGDRVLIARPVSA